MPSKTVEAFKESSGRWSKEWDLECEACEATNFIPYETSDGDAFRCWGCGARHVVGMDGGYGDDGSGFRVWASVDDPEVVAARDEDRAMNGGR